MIKNSTGFYTVILDYIGGTYISQVSGNSPIIVLHKWLSKLNDQDLTRWHITREELARIMKDEEIVPLDGCINVWCISGSGSRGLALINLIATVEPRSGSTKGAIKRKIS
jgi:hypothetical protein